MESLGSLRRRADTRQLAALLMVTGLCAIFHPLGNVVEAIEPNGRTPSEGTPLASLCGGFILITIGIMSIFVGYNELVHGWSHKNLTGVVIVLTQTVYVAYVSDMVAIGQAARTGNAFFSSAALNPSPSDVWFVGACGITGVIAYGFTFAGTIAFFQFALYTYQAGKPQRRSAPYYAERLGVYCGMLGLAGVAQCALGVYLALNFGVERLDGTVGVAMFVVNYPLVTILVGFLQIVCGLWGVCRSQGFLVWSDQDMSFPAAMFVLSMIQLVLQILVQVGIGGPTPAGATIFALIVGQNLMPAYLDYKSWSVPQSILPSYYYGTMEHKTTPYEEKHCQDQTSVIEDT